MTVGKERLGWLVVIILVIVAVAGLAISLLNRPQPAPIEIIPAVPTATSLPTVTPLPTATAGPLWVYITGAVVAPEVYALPSGSIVRDAVEMAGGFTADAAREAVNLAQTVHDGLHIHVPAVGEAMPDLAVASPTTAVTGPVNINVATQAELEQLPGIGPTLAQEILNYRETNGLFANPSEIMEVPGIGPATFEQIEALIIAE